MRTRADLWLSDPTGDQACANVMRSLRNRPVAARAVQSVEIVAVDVAPASLDLWSSLLGRHRRAYPGEPGYGRKVSQIAEGPAVAGEPFTALRSNVTGNEDGCSSKCA